MQVHLNSIDICFLSDCDICSNDALECFSTYTLSGTIISSYFIFYVAIASKCETKKC